MPVCDSEKKKKCRDQGKICNPDSGRCKKEDSKKERKSKERKSKERKSKPKKSKEKSERITFLKDKISLLEKFLKKNNKPLFGEKIENVDEKIFNESRERVRDIFLIQDLMRESAVDCRLFHKLHKKKYNMKCSF